MTSHQIPDGFEELPATFLRLHGAVEGMMYRYKQREDRFTLCPEGLLSHDSNYHFEHCDFAAPLGTIAAATTPLPEPRCDCGGMKTTFPIPHQPHCSIHRRYRHILPGELAKMPTKPEGLMTAYKGTKEWHLLEGYLVDTGKPVYDFSRFAYALPLPPQPEKVKGGEAEVLQLVATLSKLNTQQLIHVLSYCFQRIAAAHR